MNAIETLRKLINHEARANEVGNVHEAAAAAGRIQALMTKHKLTMTDLEIASREESDPTAWQGITLGERRKKIMDIWRVAIVQECAHADGCETAFRKDDSVFSLIGRAADREVALNMIVYFVGWGFEMFDQAWKDEMR